jgi:hypothetical protein
VEDLDSNEEALITIHSTMTAEDSITTHEEVIRMK